MNTIYKIVALVGVSVLTTSCFNKERPNYQFMSNMYTSSSYETYGEVPTTVFENGKEGQLPAEGSVPRGFQPEEYANTPEGLAEAKVNLKSPLSAEEKDLEKGKALYTIYCSVCHGDAGDGKGTLVKKEKFLGVPNYKERELTEGGIYHVITYGLNAMGSHANQLTQHERWLVTDYVLKLKSE
ncbi:cytochrome c [Myroides marinus]|jgi:mono/diheme cytochrome c family protein|uniref:Cytochrome C n=1 Tax=Myroides marinus TaxID=703342 RepID=A0A161RUM8_9FLAO|nr:cytochrome c [Myroides marinus]KUF41941.1 cytochrome C [Myroides marinus]KZE75972.1 cytochrome C [Myroides marinus]MDM1347469.1 cytochrome c [Myroides marinus]MDM1351022.1 cytochrome c [Myroides marinus]MDM1355310.1 cytochrome c [Myroides marinus]